jgi:hypothetical protein
MIHATAHAKYTTHAVVMTAAVVATRRGHPVVFPVALRAAIARNGENGTSQNSPALRAASSLADMRGRDRDVWSFIVSCPFGFRAIEYDRL